MKRPIIILSIIAISSKLLFPQSNEWDDLAVNTVGVEPVHAGFMYYADKASALACFIIKFY